MDLTKELKRNDVGEKSSLLSAEGSPSVYSDRSSLREEQKVDLRCRKLCFSREVVSKGAFPFSFRNSKERKQILHNIDVKCRPGELVALMGPSGAGKTTLLNVMAGRANGLVEGEVLVNGEMLQPWEMRMVVKVVPQEDILFDMLTPNEILYYTFRLFYPNMSDQVREERTREILTSLGIDHVADVKVGNALDPGLSGGQKKRASVAMELVTDPGLIFLDECTSGLDSDSAMSLVRMLKGLAASERTVVCTIHQPSFDVFALFDKLVLLDEGRVAYEGPPLAIVDHFRDCGFECPKYHNPADFIFEVMAKQKEIPGGFSFTAHWEKRHASVTKAGLEKKGVFVPNDDMASALVSSPSDSDISAMAINSSPSLPGTLQQQQDETEVWMNTSSSGQRLVRSGSHAPSAHPIVRMDSILPTGEVDLEFKSSWFWQFYVLFTRAAYMTITDKKQLRSRVILSLIVGVFYGLVYFQLADDQQEAQDRVSVIFSCLLFSSMNLLMQTVLLFPVERAVITREFSNGTYYVGAYYLSRIIGAIIFQFFYAIVFVTVVYWMAGLYPSAYRFFVFYLGIALMGSIAVCLGVLLGAWIPSVTLVPSLVSPILMPLIVLSGFLIRPENIPIWFKPIYYISFITYGLQLLVTSQFRDLYLGDCCPLTSICPLGPSFCTDESFAECFGNVSTIPFKLQNFTKTCVDGNSMLRYYGYEDTRLYVSGSILSGMLLVIMIAGGLVMYWRVTQKTG